VCDRSQESEGGGARCGVVVGKSNAQEERLGLGSAD
jgi:hypothetical protein